MIRVALHGVPRSGTSWLGEILNSAPEVIYRYQPLFSYAFKNFLTPSASREEIEQFFDLIATSDDAFLSQQAARDAGHMPRFSKTMPTHVIYKEVRYHHLAECILRETEDVKFIFLIRDPRAVIASWLRAGREFRHDQGWEVRREWRSAPSKNLNRPEEFYGYEKWKEAAGIFISLAERYPDRVNLLWYSDLLTACEDTVHSLFDFCGLTFSPQTRNFILGRMVGVQDNDYSVFRNKRSRDDGWRGQLAEDIACEIEIDLAGSQLARFLEDQLFPNEPTSIEACSE